jgi:hypothetical protein
LFHGWGDDEVLGEEHVGRKESRAYSCVAKSAKQVSKAVNGDADADVRLH